MMNFFSERYCEQIKEPTFLSELSYELTVKLVNHLNDFDEPSREQVSRYDGYLVDTYAKYEVLKIYWGIQGWNNINSIKDVTDEWFFKRENHELFDIIEIWCDVLSQGEKSPFQSELNSLMKQYDMPWRLLDGNFIKIDSQQFEQDLKNKALIEMEELSKIQPEFRSAYSEFHEACENLTNKDNKYAILNACKSFESVLKVVLNENRGTPDYLTKMFIESKYMNTLPLDVKKTGFQEKVLMGLPFLRNNIAGHGDGKESYQVPESLANLSINLAAALNTYFIEQYRTYVAIEKNQEKQEVDDEIPF